MPTLKIFTNTFSVDFVVNEVDKNDNIAQLARDSDIVAEIDAKKEENKDEEESKEETTEEQGPKKIVISEEAKKEATDLLGEESESLFEFIRKLNEGLCERTEQFPLRKSTWSYHFLARIEDKEKRTNVHKFFKAHLSQFDTFTREVNGEKKIMILLTKELSNNKRRKLKMHIAKVNLHPKL